MYFKDPVLKRKFKLVQLADIIINDMHVKRNDIVMVHISLGNIKLIDSTPEDLIFLLKMIVGTGGTLLMPTYLINDSRDPNSASTFDIRSAFISYDPIVELFRQMPDTFQSCSPAESFAAWGGMAKNISEYHYKSENETFRDNLFYKLCQLKAKIIGIGIRVTDDSFLHSISKTNYKASTDRYSEVIKREGINTSRDPVTGIFQDDLPDILKSESPDKISKHFKPDELKVFQKKGIPFFRVNAEKAYNKILSFSKRGNIA
jgi:aminoglycoside N3'-acetyltransferase